jgi:phosphosulfolactate synthase (CoM biosynthesis protein A)
VCWSRVATRFANTLAKCKRIGFDVIEISVGFVLIPTDDWLRLIEFVR